MKYSSFIICLASATASLSGYTQDYRQLHHTADSLSRQKDYYPAARIYLQSATAADFKSQRASGLYDAACSYSLAGNKDSAFIALHQSIDAGYNNLSHLLTDKDLEALHGEKEWRPLVQSVKPDKKVLNQDPARASLITDDIHRFWRAYERAEKDTADRIAIYKRYYFDSASRGMEDYMGLKVSSIRGFIKHHDERPVFYRAIRENTLKVDSLKPAIYSCFNKLKTLYPQAQYPDVYFIVGAFTSAGTVSNAGLLIGIDQACRTDDIPVNELTLWQKNNFNPLRNLPGIISHELIHFEQDELLKMDDTTTLFAVEVEGMADFLGEMISGKNINQRLHDWAKGKERRIWQAFTKDMYFDRYSNWIANSDQETPDNPADQGYWIGYQICQAYYRNATDKHQAIYDMLHFKNATAFLKASKWEEMVASYP